MKDINNQSNTKKFFKKILLFDKLPRCSKSNWFNIVYIIILSINNY